MVGITHDLCSRPHVYFTLVRKTILRTLREWPVCRPCILALCVTLLLYYASKSWWKSSLTRAQRRADGIRAARTSVEKGKQRRRWAWWPGPVDVFCYSSSYFSLSIVGGHLGCLLLGSMDVADIHSPSRILGQSYGANPPALAVVEDVKDGDDEGRNPGRHC